VEGRDGADALEVSAGTEGRLGVISTTTARDVHGSRHHCSRDPNIEGRVGVVEEQAVNREIKVKACIESITDIVRDDLNTVLENLQDDLKRRKAGNSIAIFHMTKDEDIAELQRHIEAFKLVLKYYGGV
jgi:CBS-domain-containing membrane protein